MPIERTESLESTRSFEWICSILSCDSGRFSELYDGKYSNDLLLEDALKFVRHHREDLRSANKNVDLFELLFGMLNHAPHPLGQRYISITCHIAASKENPKDAVVEVAQAWLNYLFLPMLTKSRELLKVQPSSSQTPTIDTTAVLIENATRSDQAILRDKVALRERHRCAITKSFDGSYAQELLKAGRSSEIPNGPRYIMNAAHIIPFSLNDFNENISKAAHVWELLQSWTQIDIKRLVGNAINSPANAIYMTNVEHQSFGQFNLYFDKEAYPETPNKYKVQMVQPFEMSNGESEADIEFSATENGIEPPNPDFLKIHAAFAKVLHLSGAAEYIDRIERDAERNDLLSTSEGWDTFASLLSLRTGVPVLGRT